MADAPAPTLAPPRSLRDLTRLIQHSDGFPEVLAALKNGKGGAIDGAWGSAAPLAAAALAWHAPGPMLVVIPHVGDLDDFAEDLAAFAGVSVETLPAWERPPSEATAGDELLARRLRVARRFLDDPPRVVVASMQALMQPVPTPAALAKATRSLRVGETVPVEGLIAWLVDRGMTRVEVVEVAGEFSLRGGILDVFPLDRAEPVRIEFFGDDVESIRPFDPESQRSLGGLEAVALTAPSAASNTEPEALGHLADYLPEGGWVALVEPEDLKEQGGHYLARVERRRGLFTVEGTFRRLTERPSIALSAVASSSLETTCRLRVESVERFSGELAKVKAELESASAGHRVLIACHNAAEVERLGEVFADTGLVREGRLELTLGRVRSGFHLIDAGLLVIGDHELFDRAEVRRGTGRRRYESRAIDSFLDLNEGDLVVHVNHGIARYRGLQLVDKEKGAGYAEEQLVLEFAEGTRLYVPIATIDLVQKYVGGGKADPPLSKIGSSAWEKRKRRVAEAVVDLAQDLIQIQAQRASSPGIAYPAEDSHWLAEFEAAFPYQETPDQLSAIESIKRDMAQPRPMDRLICGDVGYGKTEVAMRAAFKAADAGKQVAVLVPTTVLAEQHHRTFTRRMAEFPFRIEVINRFRPRSEVRQVLKDTAAGTVDILIGTHRLVQKDVAFRDLGLIIIDEEQRFGVEDKEWLKSLRATVDILTLSATPIPRTLHMALLGIRDISNLETPPPDRKAIETRITRWDDAMIRQAIRRELNRDGQIYFVHNKVYDIQSVADRIQQLVPEARIIVGHGQMAGEELERAMMAFVRHEADILVATTIIESGLDIPNANTIFIHEADRYGLADLHQLRGRVGRSKNRAYAYMILEESKSVTPNAVRRLKAIEEFTDLGAGFKIALRDLEIRGAGNILGAEQSGHIEAVGYELYCSLLEGAVRSLTGKGERPRYDCSIELSWRAYLPAEYVPSHKLKVELYRRVGRLRSLERLADFRQELVDRFGPLPEPADHLLVEAELRILAEHWMINRLHVEDGFLVLSYRNAKRIQALARQHPPGMVRIVDGKSAYVPLGDDRGPAAIASLARALLSPPKPAREAVRTEEGDAAVPEKAAPVSSPSVAIPADRAVPVRQGLQGRTRRKA
ncbi:transcription-repair coupling factor [Tautonia sociabilis]|uniref:Transcription-repair-coupling factor n=1 Tax=Tautonia sociabilis TaxID=2080755 RepID=A0A432MLA7_9BACT|nr:transcription-repair coupling factor [Tautonia sociabilis]RUL88049.1 transcription-repair coupling factor [Tautonia sociabilis]